MKLHVGSSHDLYLMVTALTTVNSIEDSCQEEIVQLGGLPHLIALLISTNDATKLPATKCLGIIANNGK
jgi:hypothetical protein